MPRRYRKRRPIGKIVQKRTGSKTAGQVAQVAMAGYRLAKRVARLINTEVKHYTTDGVLQKNYSGGIVDLCDPAQGDGQEERVGNQIKPLHLTIRGYAAVDSTGGPTEIGRLIIFRYKDENGQALAVGDILDSDIVGTTKAPLAGKAYDNRYHSKILFDKTFYMGYNASGAQDTSLPSVRSFKFSTKLYGHINWTDTTTTQEGGGLYMLWITAEATEANAPTLTYVSRVTYTDN